MIGIDELLDMLDWNNDPTIQAKGIELARDVKTTNPFVLPMDSKYGKNVWENCAKIINDTFWRGTTVPGNSSYTFTTNGSSGSK